MSSSTGRVDYKAQVLGAVDIVDVIGQTVALKKAGKDYKGLCPFHQEKTPSFTVNPAKQFFHCYGCKAGGDVFRFVELRDRVDFKQALRTLGEMAGLGPPEWSGYSKEKAGEKQTIYDANSAACAFFQQVLSDPVKGAAGRAYLEQRGIDADSVKRFQIGLAADAWDALLAGPVGRKFTAPQLASAGLAKARETGGHYDTFRNRLMFPIKDAEGRVVAFGGRVMPGSNDPAKYLNSPETPVFSKKASVFGVQLARQRILESRTAVIVEGYTDVVMAHQFGASNVVSVLGTAMTEQHVKLLRRYLSDEGGRIVLLFDSDTAGDVAVDRSVGLFLTQEVEIAIASLPAGVDPDEFLLTQGADAFDQLVAGAPDALTYKWKQLTRQFEAEGDSLTGQQKAVEQYMELLASARGSGPVDSLRWGAALARVSRLTGIPVDQLNRRFRGTKQGRGIAPKSGFHSESIQAGAPDGTMNLSPDAGGAGGAPNRLVARDRAERWILGILLIRPGWWKQVQKVVGVSDFTDDNRQRLAQAYWDHQRDEGEPVFNEFLGILGDAPSGDALRELAIEVLDEVEALPDPQTTLDQAVGLLDEERRQLQQRKLFAELRRTNEGDQTVDMLRKYQEQGRLPNLRRT